MKIVLLFSLLPILAFGQTEESTRKFNWGLNANTNVGQRIFYDPFNKGFSLLATASSEKHQFEFGPDYYTYSGFKGHGTGLSFNYKYYPNGYQNRFHMFFISSARFKYCFFNERASAMVNSQEVVYGDYRGEVMNGSLRLGYGIELNLTKKMYLGTDVGYSIGYGTYGYKETFSDTQYNEEFSDNALYLYPSLRLNFGFRF